MCFFFCVFATSSLSLPSSCLPSRLFCHPSVGPSAGHIIGLIVPANSNVVSSRLASALSSCLVCFISLLFLFSSFLFFFFPSSYSFFSFFLFVLFFFRVYVPWIYIDIICSWYCFWLRDGIPQLVSTVPFRTGDVVRVLYYIACVLLSRRLLSSLFCDHRLDFTEMSKWENIIIISRDLRRPPRHPEER